jgi:hypothetical protein
MKTAFLSFCLLAPSLFLFTGCKKDGKPSTGAPDYIPLTVGSNWTYSSTEGTSDTSQFTLTVSDKDTGINGKTYKVLSSSDGSENTYLAKIDSNYYRYSSISDTGNIEELYLKDNSPVNTRWTNSTSFTIPESPTPLTADLTYLIKEKGISHLVNGKTYSDVIHIAMDISVPVLAPNFGDGDFYYANGIGLIQSSIRLAVPGLYLYYRSKVLVSHQIK